MDKNIFIANLLFKHLQGTLSDREKEIFEEWLAKPENNDFLQSMEESELLFENMNDMLQTDTKQAYTNIMNSVSIRKRKQRLVYFSGIAASFLLVCVLSVFFLFDKNEPEPTQSKILPLPSVYPENAILTKANGNIIFLEDSIKALDASDMEAQPWLSLQRQPEINKLQTLKKGKISVMLHDGTKVWLNEETLLEYPNVFDKKKRVVKLQGEAFFEVAKDNLRPFIVESGGMSIQVLGTVFNVNSTTEEGCVATLVEGKVCIRNQGSDSVIIHKGQQVILNKLGYLNVKNVDVSYYTAWLENRFAFKNTELEVILKTIAQWYNYDYVFETESLKKIKYTSIIQQYEELQNVLDVLNNMAEFNCKIINNKTIMVTQ